MLSENIKFINKFAKISQFITKNDNIVLVTNEYFYMKFLIFHNTI